MPPKYSTDSDFTRKNGKFRNPLTAHEGWGPVSVPGLIFYNMIGYLSQKLAMLETSIRNLQTVTGLKNASKHLLLKTLLRLCREVILRQSKFKFNACTAI